MPEQNEEQMKAIAAQLRKPHGEYADEVANKMNEANAHLNQYTIEALDLQPGTLVVEVGMGNGFFVPEILSKNGAIRYVGCDYSLEMIDSATKLNKSAVQEGRAIFHFAPADKLPLENAMADILFTINTVYFWDNPASVLAEFRRVIRSGGKLVLALRPKRSMENYPFTKFGFVMYSREELVSLIAGAGFKVSEIIEKEEPAQVIDGGRFIVESLIIVSVKQV